MKCRVLLPFKTSRSTDPNVFGRQFGDDAATYINTRGYYADLQAVILALDLKEALRLDLSEFLSLIYFDLGKFDSWIRSTLGNLPIELRLPKTKTTSEPGDFGDFQRCGIWVQPQFSNRSILRIEGVIPTTDQNVNTFLSFIKNNLHASDISELHVIGSVCSTLAQVPQKPTNATKPSRKNAVLYESTLSFAGSLFWQNSSSRVDFAVSLSDSSLSLYLQPPKSLTLQDISKWIIEKFKSSVKENGYQKWRKDSTNMQLV